MNSPEFPRKNVIEFLQRCGFFGSRVDRARHEVKNTATYHTWARSCGLTPDEAAELLRRALNTSTKKFDRHFWEIYEGLLEDENREFAEEQQSSSLRGIDVLHDIYIEHQKFLDQFSDAEIRRMISKIPVRAGSEFVDHVMADERALSFYKALLGEITYHYYFRKVRWTSKKSSKQTNELFSRVLAAVQHLDGDLNQKRWHSDIVPFLGFQVPPFSPPAVGFTSGFTPAATPEIREAFYNRDALRFVVEPFRLQIRMMRRMLVQAKKKVPENNSRRSRRGTPIDRAIVELAAIYEGRQRPAHRGCDFLTDVTWPVALEGVSHKGESARHQRYGGPFLDFVREFFSVADPPVAHLKLGRTVYNALITATG